MCELALENNCFTSEMMRSPTVNAINWNNLAVRKMRVGDHAETIRMFDMALAGLTSCASASVPELRGLCNCGASFELGCSPIALHHSSKAIVHSVNVDKIGSPGAILTSNDEMLTSPSNSFTFYNRAFVFCDHNEQLNLSRWMACVPHVHSILLFNAGLACHRLAIKGGRAGDFTRALDFYNLSMILLERNAQNGLYAPELDVLFLALFNNLGHIHSHFFQREQAAMCLESLAAILYRTDSKYFLTKEEWVLFDMTILAIGRQPNVAPAA